MLARTIDAAERGWLPDPVIRKGIQWLLRSRLAGEQRRIEDLGRRLLERNATAGEVRPEVTRPPGAPRPR